MEITREELKQVMREVILEVLDERAPQKANNKELLTVDEAVMFLNENGCPITKKQIYNLRYDGLIPYSRSGKRLIFNRQSLYAYAEKRKTFDSEQSKKIAAETLANEAKRRERRQFNIA